MTKFKVGDKFIPRKPNHYDIAKLRSYWNCTYTVRAINNEWVIARENGLLFHVDWCEKAEERVPDIRKTIATGIDWEQRRYEIAKEFMAAHIAGCISGGVQWFYKTSAAEVIVCADELIKQLQKNNRNLE